MTEIIAHRINTIELLKRLPKKYGVELDLRDRAQGLVIGHDPFCEGDDFEKYLDEELIRWGVDYIDFYLMHNLSYGNWEKVKRLDGFSFFDKMIQKGKIR